MDHGNDDDESGVGQGQARTRTRGEPQRILSVFGAAASADATTTEHDDESVDERGRYEESLTAAGRFWQQQYH